MAERRRGIFLKWRFLCCWRLLLGALLEGLGQYFGFCWFVLLLCVWSNNSPFFYEPVTTASCLADFCDSFRFGAITFWTATGASWNKNQLQIWRSSSQSECLGRERTASRTGQMVHTSLVRNLVVQALHQRSVLPINYSSENKMCVWSQ